MNNDKFQNEAIALRSNAEKSLLILIESFGICNKINGEKALVLDFPKDEDLMFNFDGKGFLSEIQKKNLVSSEGHYYNFEVLTLDELCRLTDHFTNKFLS